MIKTRGRGWFAGAGSVQTAGGSKKQIQTDSTTTMAVKTHL